MRPVPASVHVRDGGDSAGPGVLLLLSFAGFQLKEENRSIFTKKTEKRKPIPQGRREGMSRLPVKKFLPLKIN